MRKIIICLSLLILFLFSLIPLCFGNENEKISLSDAENLIGLKPLKEITKDEVWSIMEAQVFSYLDEIKATGSSFLVKDGKVTKLCSGFGGYGIDSMCVSDLNKNQKPELLFLYHIGSGINFTIPGCYEDGKTISVSFYSRHTYDCFFKKIDLNKIQILTHWHDKLELNKDQKTFSIIGQKEIIVGELFFENDSIGLSVDDGLPSEVTRNIAKSVFGMSPPQGQ